MLLAALLSPAAGARAQTFEEVLAQAAEDHPRLVAAQHLIRGGEADVSASRSAARPQVGVQADVGYLNGGTNTGSGLAVLPEVRVSQLIYDGGRTPAEIRRRKVRVDILGVQEEQVLSELSLQLALAWIDYTRATELIAISEQQVSALSALKGIVDEIASFDRGRASDVVMVGSRLEQAITTLQTRQISQAEARARIREIAAEPVEPQGAIPTIAPYLPESAEACQALVPESPTVRIADLQVEENEELVSGTRNWWSPQLAIEGARTSEQTASGDTRLFNDFAVRLRVSALPFDSGGGRARHESAKASLDASESNAELTQTALRDQAQRLWVFQAQRTDRIPSLVGLIDLADDAREIVFEQFRIGRRTILDVLSYDLERFNVRAQLVNERFDILQTQYQLMGVLGLIYPTMADAAATQPAEAAAL